MLVLQTKRPRQLPKKREPEAIKLQNNAESLLKICPLSVTRGSFFKLAGFSSTRSSIQSLNLKEI
ncbi:unnamed protein product, partial [Amoebophrya sp. A25]|eukprot:GSA25T00027196001.1